MTTPRIYTYKVTFEEVPYWYWGVHKEKKYGKTYLGSPKTHKWMWEFYTPKIQILEFFPNTEEGWKEANLVEKRLIKHDFNNPLCLNEAYGAFISLAFRSEGGKKGATKTNEKKDKNGKSLAGVKGSEKTNAQIWESTIDGFRGNAGNVSRHNRANGWDPNARIRVN